MKFNKVLKTLGLVLLIAGCDKESPELIPCMCDGSESTLGLFDCMCEPMKKKPVKRFSYLQDTNKPRYQTVIIDAKEEDTYLYLHQRRDYFAPIKLENVDFRIRKGRGEDTYNTKLGDYRFRIFGCRRESKNVYLNEGRAMQKDMHFFDVFFETMNEFYPVVVGRKNTYYNVADKRLPEYLVTAEIVDYYMNICDEFDWDKVEQKKLRSGSSEMTVVWRIMSLDKSEVYCKGMSSGYGQISQGEPNGETLLAERAFEDALLKLPEIQCVNSTLSQRIRPEEIERQLGKVRRLQLGERPFMAQYENELRGVERLQECSEGYAPQYETMTPLPLEHGCQGCAEHCGEGALVPVGDYIAERGGVDGTGAYVGEPRALIGSDGVVECGQTGAEGAYIQRLADTIMVDDDCRSAKIVDDGVTVVENVGAQLRMADDYWVDIPLDGDNDSRKVLENAVAQSENSFCIRNQQPYRDLNPQNLYKVRASVVAVENAAGRKGSGLIIADNLVLTSADLIVKNNNNFKLQTINGKHMSAAAVRVNPDKNVALLLLDKPTEFAPLPLSLALPEVNKDVLMTLGLFDFNNDGEGYIDNQGRVIGYRWTTNGDPEIMVDTFVQSVSIGGALIDSHGNIVGLAHKEVTADNNPDLFVPIEVALRGLGLRVCGREFGTRKPVGLKTYETPLADAIDKSVNKAPKPMAGLSKK